MGKPKTIRVNLVQEEGVDLLLAIDTAIGNARDAGPRLVDVCLREEGLRDDVSEAVTCPLPMTAKGMPTFAEAKAWARAEAVRRGVTLVGVCS